MRIYDADFPMSEALTGPGGAYELEDRLFRGEIHRMFRHGPRTFGETLARAAAAMRDRPGARMAEQDGRATTYGEAFAMTAALARTLTGTLGVRPGQHVAISMANRAEWIISLMAVVAAGAVPAMVNSRGVGEELDRAIRLADCVVAIADRERHALGCAYAEPAWRSIVLDAPDLLVPGRDLDFAEAARPVPGLPLRFAETDPEAPGVIMYSSGTTGFPKAILHSTGGMAHALTLGCLVGDVHDLRFEAQFGEALPVERRTNTSTSVISSPLFHMNGVMPFLRSIMHGQPVILISKWNVDAVFDVMQRETVSRLGLVPTMVFDMLASPRASAGGMDRLHFLGSGTAPLSPAVAARMREALPRCLMFNSYGQSETGERVVSLNGREFEENLEAVGRVLPSVQLRIVRDDGSDAEPGETGEILTRSPSGMIGYYNDPKATAETLKDGWICSGDIGRFDERGLLHVLDRKKNMVISGGENIYCAEVERVLGEHPDALEAIAYGEPDPRLGERLVATVVLKPDAQASEEAMKAYARSRLAIYKVPRAVAFTHTPLPRTATGKVARGEFLKARKAAA
jgi:acyl-CoA synthetase (AMP-forming)/AMP-acid ligase II